MKVASYPIVVDAVLHEQLSLHAVSIKNCIAFLFIIAAIISFQISRLEFPKTYSSICLLMVLERIERRQMP